MTLVAGLGFRAGCSVDSLRSALQAALQAASAHQGEELTIAHVRGLATAADKAHHPALLQLAAELQLDIHPVSLLILAKTPSSPSENLPDRYGNHSVAESSALAAAGPVAALLGGRSISPDRMATAALACIENTSP
ncbi:cobalamin biosynthesis protein [Rhodoferax sp. TBRC 17660]|uniref:Cobalamin biosynthesis protein n=1 Tax=Rhodoferax potami TaxID=3068338 RepID=A0ABU3KJ32_9BURK|nr:cobalamin biosynthesis protein [Rhodoferax sp. TBRC 17660]MDT7517304.1 cobalamin biosynthesis protein [Rhodoferax sp. TBRC 17660]